MGGDACGRKKAQCSPTREREREREDAGEGMSRPDLRQLGGCGKGRVEKKEEETCKKTDGMFSTHVEQHCLKKSLEAPDCCERNALFFVIFIFLVNSGGMRDPDEVC